MNRVIRSLSVILALGTAANAADWPQFRGPNGSAVSPESGLPTKFTKDTGLRWKAELPGRGLAAPVIVGGRVFVTASSGSRDDRLHVLCFDAGSGAKLWHRQLAATGSTACHPKTCMAAPTPVADDSGVYALFATGDLAAFDTDGSLRWYRSIVGDYPTVSNQVGMASSPILYKDKLIVPMDNAGESFLAAFDSKTGKNIWKVTRPRVINWVTPLLRERDGKAEILFGGGKELTAYDADTGKELWTAAAGGTIPSPTLDDDLLLIASRGVTAFTLKGDETQEAWKSARMNTGMSSPLVYDKKVYAANPSSGIIICADGKTGDTLWQERVKGPFSASPVAGDGKLYVLNEAGVLTVLKLGDEPEVVGVSEMGEEGLATPAISGGAIFLRGSKTLFCVGSKLGG